MRKPWTDPDLALLKTLYPNTPTKQVATVLQRNIGTVYRKANLLGLTKSKAFLASPESGRTNGIKGKDTRFKKGNIPWNKGMKGRKATGRAVETQFKPGQLNGRAAEMYQPLGSERVTRDGIRQRKIRDDGPSQYRWRAVHALLWEEHNGPIPKGHIVVFKDGNRENITLENLELITRAELMNRNSYHNYPKEIAELIQLRGAVQRQINKRMKA